MNKRPVTIEVPAAQRLTVRSGLSLTTISNATNDLSLGTPDVPVLLTALAVAWETVRAKERPDVETIKELAVAWSPDGEGWIGEAGGYTAIIEPFTGEAAGWCWRAYVGTHTPGEPFLTPRYSQSSYSLAGAMMFCIDRLLFLLLEGQ